MEIEKIASLNPISLVASSHIAGLIRRLFGDWIKPDSLFDL